LVLLIIFEVWGALAGFWTRDDSNLGLNCGLNCGSGSNSEAVFENSFGRCGCGCYYFPVGPISTVVDLIHSAVHAVSKNCCLQRDSVRALSTLSNRLWILLKVRGRMRINWWSV
jgi:hypothetical protein